MTSRRRSAAALTVAFLLLASGCADDDDDGLAQDAGVADDEGETAEEEGPAAGQDGGLAEVDCAELVEGFEPGPVVVRCGTVDVPLDHDDADGASIKLAVAIVPATAPDPAEDPLLILAGGPGEHLVASLPGLAAGDSPFAAAFERRDLILVDQRGAGLSQPALDCPEVEEALADASSADAVALSQEATAECHTRLTDEEGIDLSAFDTAANVADLEVLREELGYETWNLFGTSYGARLVLQYQRDHADVVRAAVQSSPIPAEENFVADAGSSYAAAVEEVFAACAADPACDQSFPDLSGTLTRVLESLAAAPVMVELADPETGEPVPTEVGPEVVAGLLFTLFYDTTAVQAIPALVTQLGAGDFSAFTAAGGEVAAAIQISQGMLLSFLCAEEVADQPLDELQEANADLPPLVGEYYLPSSVAIGYPVYESCDTWDVEEADDETFEPVESDAPNLVVTGRFDQITSPDYADVLEEQLPNATFVEAATGHSPLLSLEECGITLLSAYIEDPEADLDTTCAETAPEFTDPAAEAAPEG